MMFGRYRNANKKMRLRKKMLVAFSAVLFSSFFLTAVIFNIVIRMRMPATEEGYMPPQEHVFIGMAGTTQAALVVVMFFVAVVVTYFLANSITHPIEKLGKFALGIGSGNFKPNDYEFNDIELEELNAALNKSVRQLAVYDSEQKTFFQNASHELRTPLMSIKCYAEGLVYGLMDSKQAGETILAETDKLAELVSDLLYISKIDNITTAYATSVVNLVDIIKDSAGRQQAMADKGQISFAFTFDRETISYECVPELMARAIDNLISNAIRYASSEIAISCHKKQKHIVITVSDDGKGIDSEILPHVFERFYKGEGGNTGIGLAIVKSIVDQLNGSIKAENSDKGGAVFTINLPL
ncbi:MAG: HAMP domain-containing histidine kinase [Defluviitaleaceae bacterium]|nr:HAMP domain-containing histidine kinase [Defluviitaleaceae bacterium]